MQGKHEESSCDSWSIRYGILLQKQGIIGITEPGTDKTTFATLINCFKKYETELWKANSRREKVPLRRINRRESLPLQKETETLACLTCQKGGYGEKGIVLEYICAMPEKDKLN